LQLVNVKYVCDCAIVAKQVGSKKFIGIGTISEKIAQNIMNAPVKSDAIIYGIAKDTTRSMLDIVCKNLELPYIWAQLSNIYGPNNETGNIVSYTLSALKKGDRPTFSEARQPYDLMSVQDAAFALALLGEKRTTKNIYFVGSGEPRILRDYLLSMGEVLGNEKLLGIGERPDDNIQFNLEWFNTNDLEVDTGFMVQNSFEENIKNIKCLK